MREQMELAALMPTIREVIDAGGVFRLYPRGKSMLPLLVEGEDSIELGAAEPYAVAMPCCTGGKTGSLCCTV